MDNCNSVKTPLSSETDLFGLIPILLEQTEMKSVSYLLAVSSLQYFATITQLDIAYAVFYLGKFNYNPHPAY